ncbi:MAG TPA: GNAT family N-acetyltransferase, partial [Pirellulales bacterium]
APWIGYLAERNGEIVGACGFKGPPRNGRVEISYYAFPDYEREGVGAAMALLLVMVAATKDPSLTVAARTPVGVQESSGLLKKLGFAFHGHAETLEDGKMLEWRRAPLEPALGLRGIRACG